MTAKTTAADYLWIRERYASLTEAYCLTLVQDITPERLLQELGAEPVLRVTGVEGLGEPSYASWDECEGDRLFVGVAAVGDWSLMAEYNGYVGVRPAAMLPVSRGRRVVSHFRNVNAVDHFYWFEDGEVRLHFQPLFAHNRDGSDPDGLSARMREVGFDLSDAEDRDYHLHTEAAFALAHHLTGIRLTSDLLDSARFTCGLVALPRG
jgi:hypothetical protein